MSKQCLNPASLFNSQAFGFSQIVVADPGKQIFLSGQVAWDAERNIVGRGDLGIQLRKAFENVETGLAAVGASLANIVMIRLYLVNYEPVDGTIVSSVLHTVFDGQTPPASTWISVKGLANPDFLVEVEVQAIL